MASKRFKRVLALDGVHAIEVTDGPAVAKTFELIRRIQRGRPQEAEAQIDEIAGDLWKSPSSVHPCVILACTELPLAFHTRTRDAVFESGASRTSIRWLFIYAQFLSVLA